MVPANNLNRSVNIRFADPARGDFRQRISSQAVDVLPPVAGDDRDLDNRPYDQFNTIYSATNTTTPRDVGAYERLASDPWLINGDFNGDLNLWTLASFPASTTYSTLNGAGSSGGSLNFSRGAIVGEPFPFQFNVAHQCFNVPAPGVYSLTAQGRAPGPAFISHDRPWIQMVVYYNSGNCTGAFDATAEAFIPNSNSFAPLTTPVSFTVTPALFTPNTSIEVRLNITQDVAETGIDAGFDQVVMTGASLDKMFADGFE